MKFERRSHRAREALLDLGRQFPDAWDSTRPFFDGELSWPSWCYLPMAGWYAVASQYKSSPIETAILTSQLAALGAWRMTQGIYRFDPALYPALVDSEISDDIPVDILYRLPEWCVYVETHDLVFEGNQVHGFWCHLEYDFNTKRPELRILTDADARKTPIILHLTETSLLKSIDASIAESEKQSAKIGNKQDFNEVKKPLAEFLKPALSLILYLCSQSDFSRRGKEDTPANPIPKKTKKGMKIFPASGPLEWDVGVRIGAALRKAYQAEQTNAEPNGHVRPHVRRAHWHGFRVGARKIDGVDIPADKRELQLKWLPPIVVNLDDNELPSVIRKVK